MAMTLAKISLKTTGPRSLTLKPRSLTLRARRFVQGHVHRVTEREDIAYFKRVPELNVVIVPEKGEKHSVIPLDLERREPVENAPAAEESAQDDESDEPEELEQGASEDAPEVPPRAKLSRMKRQELFELASGLDLAIEDTISRTELIDLIAEDEE
jgi:hypothetical protein